MTHNAMTRNGMTLPELLVAVAVLGLLASLGCISGSESLARQRLEGASRHLGLGIELARAAALRRNAACGISLETEGWGPPRQGTLPACLPGREPLQDSGLGDGGLQLLHNLPADLRFSSNGLVLDGGTVVLTARGTSLQRCLVMALPLGVVRIGRYQSAPSEPLNSSACLPDPSL
jgi:prepilin-type N-terminal cleavage/methylation domain-containing protein